MRRREFIILLGGTLAWPLAARAEQGERVRRIGILMPFPPTNAEMQARLRAFREELRKRGWAVGINAQFDERWTSDNMDLIRSAAANLIELNPDVILAVGARVIPILMELTRSIPIVAPSGADPIARGYAESLARPGGNVTGFATMELSIVGKMLQTLKEIAPDLADSHIHANPLPALGPGHLARSGLFFLAASVGGPVIKRKRQRRVIAGMQGDQAPWVVSGTVLIPRPLSIKAIISSNIRAVAAQPRRTD